MLKAQYHLRKENYDEYINFVLATSCDDMNKHVDILLKKGQYEVLSKYLVRFLEKVDLEDNEKKKRVIELIIKVSLIYISELCDLRMNNYFKRLDAQKSLLQGVLHKYKVFHVYYINCIMDFF